MDSVFTSINVDTNADPVQMYANERLNSKKNNCKFILKKTKQNTISMQPLILQHNARHMQYFVAVLVITALQAAKSWTPQKGEQDELF